MYKILTIRDPPINGGGGMHIIIKKIIGRKNHPLSQEKEGKEIPNQRVGEREKRKERKFPIKEWEKEKMKERKFPTKEL